tara:strand:- start:28 stop:282 length:255 start_codon:yes stop_codon:yes gene_type:complete
MLKNMFNEPKDLAHFQNGRHVKQDQFIQDDYLQVSGYNRTFWSNPDKSYSCHIWNESDRITVGSWDGETLQDFVNRTESILLRR